MRLFLLMLFCAATNAVLCQEQSQPVGFLSKNLVVPPSPEASALGQYGNVPVSLYTGRVNLGVPIYELKGKEISTSLNLSYSYGGFKPAEDPGWVGLGWTLNAGGVITRSVNGRPDRCDNYFNQGDEKFNVGAMNERQRQEQYEKMNHGDIELQPDSYFFNFNGQSGKFYINRNKDVVFMDYKPLLIEFDTPCPGDNNAKIIVTGPDGIKYYFSDRETTRVTYDDATENPIVAETYTSSWFLTEMISPNRLDTIRFNYTTNNAFTAAAVSPLAESVSYSFHGPTAVDGSGAILDPCGETQGPQTAASAFTEFTRKILQSVKYRKIEILLNSSSSNPSPFSATRLDEVIVKNRGVQVKRVVLHHSYFNDPSEIDDARLRLDSIQEYGPQDRMSPPYKFGYSTIVLPSCNTKAIDHWGYYNGWGRQWLLPNYLEPGCTQPKGGGANRDSNESVAEAGALLSVTYPTGGHTIFEYGANVIREPYVAPPGSPETYEYVMRNFERQSDPMSFLGGVYSSGHRCAGKARFQVDDFSLPDTAFNVIVRFADFEYNEPVHGPNAQAFAGVIRASDFQFNPETDCDMFEFVSTNYQLFTHYWFLDDGMIPTFNLGGLAPGEYKLVVVSKFNSINPNAEVAYTVRGRELVPKGSVGPDGLPISKLVVGGIRIQKITDYPASGSSALIKEYTYGDAKTYGVPDYRSYSTYQFIANEVQSGQSGPAKIDYNTQTLTISSSSKVGLGSIMGSHVGYGQVVERFLNASGEANGYKVYTYRNNIPEQAGNSFGLDLDEAGQGDLLREEVWNNTSILIETVNDYSFDTDRFTNASSLTGMMVVPDSKQSNAKMLIHAPGVSPTSYEWINEFNLTAILCSKWVDNSTRLLWTKTITGGGDVCVNTVPKYPPGYFDPSDKKTFDSRNKSVTYYLRGHWSYLAKTTKREYAPTGIIETYTKFTYSPSHAQPTWIERLESDGHLKCTKLRYSGDEVSGISTEGITAIDLIGSRGVSNMLIEKSEWKNCPTEMAGNITSAHRIDLGIAGNYVFAKDIYMSNSTSVFSWSNLNSKYDKRAVYQYNSDGDLVTYQKSKDTPQSFVWSSDHSQLIAEVNGALPTDVAFTSFENDGNEGGWTFNKSASSAVKAGKYSHNLLGGSITKSGLQSGTRYVLTFWAKNTTPTISNVLTSEDDPTAGADGWRFYKKVISGTTVLTISGTGLVDEVRLYPQGALMTSYVHDPVFGVTHVGDSNGVLQSFEYYPNGRLKLTRDYQGNILKSHIYHYKGEQ